MKWLAIILVSCTIQATAQAPDVEIFDRRFGGTNNDAFFSFQPTNDGGYILAGQSVSPASGDKTQDCLGGDDYWVVKIDSAGNKLWDKRFGTSGDDLFWQVQQTSDHGYILGGWTGGGPDDDKTQTSWGGTDYWVIKIDSAGNKQWDGDYGGTMYQYLYALQQTRDGGYVFGGDSWSDSSGDKTQHNWDVTLQNPDYWMIKTDSLGNKQWDKRFGYTGIDQMLSVTQTWDGGFLLGGTTSSDSGGDISQQPRGYVDYWVVKTDSLGNKQWDRRLGGQAETFSNFAAVLQCTDGGFLVAGYSDSDSGGDKSQDSKAGDDYWVIKLDNNGNKQWDKDYGGPGDDDLTNIALSTDKGYLFSGYTFGGFGAGGAAGGDKSESNLAEAQTWVVKTDSLGNKQWDKTIFTIENSGGYAMQVNDNCYAFGIATVSGIGGYKTEPNWDGGDTTGDYWIVKFCFTGKPEGIQDLTPNLQINVYPNPFSSELDINLAQQGLKQATFTIKNMLGQTVYNQTENNLSENYTKMLDLRYLPNGVYLVEVEVNGERICKEVVKQ